MGSAMTTPLPAVDVAACTSVDAVAAFVQDTDGRYSALMTALKTGTRGERQRTHKAYEQLKHKLHPANASDAIQVLRVQYAKARASGSNSTKALSIELATAVTAAAQSDAGARHARVFGRIDRDWSTLHKVDECHGRSNRSRRAPQASSVFSKHAGLTHIDGAVTDRHGNAEGGQFDLVADAAFDGQIIVILQLYPFKMGNVTTALQRKGFTVRLVTKLMSSKELDKELGLANQLWVISSSNVLLTKEHLAVMKKHFEDGMGMYIYGDNEPFYADANAALATLLPGTGLAMEGNVPGGQVVTATVGSRAVNGYLPHYLTTGLAHLFEGITIATFIPKVAAAAGCDEILRDHDGNLIVVYRPPTNGSGPLIADGAFTKLFCGWDTAGSARFVMNCAAMLAVDVGAIRERGVVDEAKVSDAVPTPVPELSWYRAPCIMCDVMFEPGPVVVMATTLGDPEIFLSDYCINNPFDMGERAAHVLGSQVYGFQVAKSLAAAGTDPFRQIKVHALIPIVPLDTATNCKIVGDALCHIFLGGKAKPMLAWMLFYAAADHKLSNPDAEHPEVWRYMMRQMDQHIETVRGFGVQPSVTATEPLVESMYYYMTSLSTLEQLRKPCTSVCLFARVLHNHMRVEPQKLWIIARRALLKELVALVMAFAKRNDTPSLHSAVDDLTFDKMLNLIVVAGSSRAVSIQSLGDMLGAGQRLGAVMKSVRRLEAKLGLGEMLHPDELAAFLGVCRVYSGTWQIATEAMLTTLISAAPTEERAVAAVFTTLWNGQRLPNGTAKTVLEQRFARLATFAPTVIAPPFATCFGPSVFYVTQGDGSRDWFADPTMDLSTERGLQVLKTKRVAKLKAMYATDNPNGYPTATSAHFNLHRAVQKTLLDDAYRAATERTPAMVLAVAQYLQKEGKGNIFVSDLVDRIHQTVDSYLELRRANAREPHQDCVIDFRHRVDEELGNARELWALDSATSTEPV